MYKKLFENKKAIFFDLDGTIIDSAAYWQQAFNKVINAFGVTGLELESFYRGISLKEEFVSLAKADRRRHPENNLLPKELPLDIMVAKVNQFFLELVKQNPPEIKDGFLDFLYQLKERKFKVALVSNSVRTLVDETLAAIGINKTAFDFTIAGNEVKHAKPDPEIYITAAKKMNLTAKEILVFEDSVSGANAAVAANMEMVLIWNGAVMLEAYPKEIRLKLSDFSTLPQSMDTTYEEDVKAAAEALTKH